MLGTNLVSSGSFECGIPRSNFFRRGAPRAAHPARRSRPSSETDLCLLIDSSHQSFIDAGEGPGVLHICSRMIHDAVSSYWYSRNLSSRELQNIECLIEA